MRLHRSFTDTSTYFCAGATKGYLPYGRPIAASITAIGRSQLLLSKQIAEDEFGMRVIYGDTDSIMMVKDDLSERYLRERGVGSDIRVRPGDSPDHAAARAAVDACFDSWQGLKHCALTPEQRSLIYAAGDDALAELMRQAEQVAARVTAAIGRPPMSLEFEALFDNYRQFLKKRFAAPITRTPTPGRPSPAAPPTPTAAPAARTRTRRWRAAAADTPPASRASRAAPSAPWRTQSSRRLH